MAKWAGQGGAYASTPWDHRDERGGSEAFVVGVLSDQPTNVKLMKQQIYASRKLFASAQAPVTLVRVDCEASGERPLRVVAAK